MASPECHALGGDRGTDRASPDRNPRRVPRPTASAPRPGTRVREAYELDQVANRRAVTHAPSETGPRTSLGSAQLGRGILPEDAVVVFTKPRAVHNRKARRVRRDGLKSRSRSEINGSDWKWP